MQVHNKGYRIEEKKPYSTKTHNFQVMEINGELNPRRRDPVKYVLNCDNYK